MQIRKMKIEDYEEVYQLWLSCKGMGLNSVDDSREGIEKFLRRNPETCFVATAEKDGKILGVIMAGNDGRRGYIYHTAVSGELEFIKAAYEFVRDNISHSADIGEDTITCAASEVLKARHGICFAKSHLLAALLRAKSVPAGFCYQKLILDDEAAPVLIYHGLNGAYIKEHKKWIRLDARGNKVGVDAQFSLETERLAFACRHT